MINILTLVLISQFLSQSEAYITSDSGFAEQFYTPWYGSRPNQYTQQVNFQSAFQNVPQVVIAPTFYELPVSSGQKSQPLILLQVEFGGVNTMILKWFALDDQRIEVIHKFNQDNPPTSIYIPRQNKNINTGFILYTSFGGAGAIDFILDMPTITDSYVQVTVKSSVTNQLTNLQNLGYSIILGPPEAFETTNIITQLPIKVDYYCSPTMPLIPNTIWFCYPLFFSANSGVFNKVKIQETKTENTISYCFSCPSHCAFTKFGHKITTIKLELTTILFPMLMKKIRVSRSYSEENVNNIQIQIGEVNKNYDAIGEDLIEITSSIQYLSMVIKVKCQPNQKVTGKFQRYLSGSNKYFTQSINCFSGQNFISYYARFYQAVQQYQYLIVSITADQILITQKIANQYLEYYVVAQANILQS